VTTSRFQDRELFYERFADEWDSAYNPYELGKRIALVFDDVLRDVDLDGRDFLDAGCGTGHFSAIAASRGARVTSLDVGDALMAQVARKVDSERVVASILELPFADRSFDVVLCTEVIEHTPDPGRAVRELARMVRPGGTLVLTTPNRVWHPAIELANRLKLRPYEGFENWSLPSQLRHWLEGAGHEVLEVRGFNLVPFVHKSLYRLNDWCDRFGHGPAGRVMINMLTVSRPL
jgi:2-polyprenyl-6-hydroxyphenyl methylase/3-demethylubiquinone-9 3-methyltransferase